MKHFKPITPSLRHLVQLDRSCLSKEKPIKQRSLLIGKKRNSGRNHQGVITVRRIGGGHKQLYRKIDFKKVATQPQNEYSVIRIEYDPNRTAFLALLQHLETHKLTYILAPEGTKIGDTLTFYHPDVTSSSLDFSIGSSIPLKYIPVGTQVHNVELKPKKGSQIIRAAGTSALIIQKEIQLVPNGPTYCQLRLPSGQLRAFLDTCMASIGTVSNSDHHKIVIGKAGRNRWLGNRPKVRGVAMNPVDHPHGGGEGKSSGGRPSVTYKGLPAKGKPTRSKSKSTRLILSKAKSLSS